MTGKGPEKTVDGEDLGAPALESANSIWFKELGMQPTFSTWSQVSYLHMYLLTVRLRALGEESAFRQYQQYLLEHFSQAAEEKMLLLHTISARSIRNKYLKDLFLRWRGVIAAYDEGLIEGDAVLASAIWRNLYKGNEDADWEQIALIVGYMRASIQELGRVQNTNELSQGILDGPDGVWARSWQRVAEVGRGR